MRILFDVADTYKKDNLTYPQLVEYNFGAKGVAAVKIFLVTFLAGACVSYVIFFVKFFEHAFDTAVNNFFVYILYK